MRCFLFSFVVLCLVNPVAAQSTFADSLDLAFAQLDLSETETGILANRRSIYLDPSGFDGTTDADTARASQWEILYGQLRTSAADTTILPSAAMLNSLAQAERDQERWPIALQYIRFDYIDSLDIDQGRLLVDQAGPVQQVYRPFTGSGSNKTYTADTPFEQFATFAASPLYGEWMFQAADGLVEEDVPTTFIIPSGLIVTLPGEPKPSSVRVNMRDGVGWRTVPVDQPFTVTYPSAGTKTVRVKAAFGGWKHARFDLVVREAGPPTSFYKGGDPFDIPSGFPFYWTYEDVCRWRARAPYWTQDDVQCLVLPSSDLAWEAPRDYGPVNDYYDVGNRVAAYDYAISRSGPHAGLRNPVILVSGFDPEESTGLADNYETIVRYRREGSLEGPAVNLDNYLKARGHDIVVMDYRDSHDFVQRNGRALIHLIREVQSQMAPGDSIDAIVGFSMGGLVTRYALAQMEEWDEPHRVRLFVSYDSPQQGATVPPGLLLTGADVLSTFRNVISIAEFLGFIAGAPGGLNSLEQRSEGAAPQQLLMFWVGRNSGLSASQAIYRQVRRDLFDDFEALGDYPENLRRVAVSNGNRRGLRQNNALEWDLSSGMRMPTGSLALYAVGEASLFGNTGAFSRTILHTTGEAGERVPLIDHHVSRCFLGFCRDITSIQKNYALPHAYDVLPGGYRATYEAFIDRVYDSSGGDLGGIVYELSGALLYGGAIVNQPRHAFVPTLSALDYNASYTSRSALVDGLFELQNFGLDITAPDMSRTPFDAIHAAGDHGGTVGFENQPHLFVTDGIANFILDQLDRGIPSRADLVLHYNETIPGGTYSFNRFIGTTTLEDEAEIIVPVGGSVRVAGDLVSGYRSTIEVHGTLIVEPNSTMKDVRLRIRDSGRVELREGARIYQDNGFYPHITVYAGGLLKAVGTASNPVGIDGPGTYRGNRITIYAGSRAHLTHAVLDGLASVNVYGGEFKGRHISVINSARDGIVLTNDGDLYLENAEISNAQGAGSSGGHGVSVQDGEFIGGWNATLVNGGSAYVRRPSQNSPSGLRIEDNAGWGVTVAGRGWANVGCSDCAPPPVSGGGGGGDDPGGTIDPLAGDLSGSTHERGVSKDDVPPGSTPFYGGYNSIVGNGLGEFHAGNEFGALARRTWWGIAPPPPSTFSDEGGFGRGVGHYPHLPSDPTEAGSGHLRAPGERPTASATSKTGEPYAHVLARLSSPEPNRATKGDPTVSADSLRALAHQFLAVSRALRHSEGRAASAAALRTVSEAPGLFRRLAGALRVQDLVALGENETAIREGRRLLNNRPAVGGWYDDLRREVGWSLLVAYLTREPDVSPSDAAHARQMIRLLHRVDDPEAVSGALDDLLAEATGEQVRTAEPVPETLSKTESAEEGLSVHPNPTRGEATVRLAVPVSGHVSVAVFDALGREVAQLVDGHRETGPLEARLSLTEGRFAPGVYMVRAEASGRVWTERITLVQ